MDNVLFIYNIFLTVFFTIVLTGFYVVYMKNRKKGFLFLSLLYFLMILDNSVIYMSEFSKSFEVLYETSDILYIVIYSIYFGIILTIRLIISEFFNDKFTIREKQFCVVVPIILVILNIFTSFQVGEFSIYFSFFTALSYIALRTYKNIKNNPNEFNEAMLKKYRVIIFVTTILSIIAIIESGIYYMSYFNDPYINYTPVSFEYRSISFDIIKLLICVIGIKNLHKSFENLFVKKDMDEKSEAKKLDDFCIEYSLTARQREIIELIIEGYSNKEISNTLHITEGTVKTHIYNIFKKTDISSRNQMLKKIMYD